MFYHSLVSDWNHGNAHFLRGIASELIARDVDVRIFEPRDGWSVQNLLAQHGQRPIKEFHAAYPHLNSIRYDLETLDLNEALDGTDLVLVHEWNDHELVARVGRHHAIHSNYRLLFHDTHHRAVTDRRSMAQYDFRYYDGVLAFGRVIRDIYLDEGWTERAWIWHEAADTRLFKPSPERGKRDAERNDSSPSSLRASAFEGDLVWVGNWGDEERTAELHEFLLRPVKELGLKARVYGVRYPDEARASLAEAGIEYAGWLPNYRVPEVFSRFRVTIHVPRRPYVENLPGIPTIRPFEALACGIPLVCSPWEDAEGLFTPGKDFLVADNGQEMKRHLKALLEDKEMARALAEHGRRTILERHTCAHRIDELLAIYTELKNLPKERAVTAV